MATPTNPVLVREDIVLANIEGQIFLIELWLGLKELRRDERI